MKWTAGCVFFMSPSQHLVTIVNRLASPFAISLSICCPSICLAVFSTICINRRMLALVVLKLSLVMARPRLSLKGRCVYMRRSARDVDTVNINAHISVRWVCSHLTLYSFYQTHHTVGVKLMARTSFSSIFVSSQPDEYRSI